MQNLAIAAKFSSLHENNFNNYCTKESKIATKINKSFQQIILQNKN